jgi:hypothetical protein
MWMASILQVLALGADPSPPPLAASAAPAPIYWRQTLFSIPFHIDRPARPAEEAANVQLYVSGDRGGRWDNWLHATPQKGFFLFKAGADGEYWFDVRTVDRSGQTRPQGPHSAKLIVIVDTASPKVQLSANRGSDGQVTARFRIEELYPKLDTLAIDYRLGANATWQAVLVGPKDVRSNNAEHTGEVTWFPQSGFGTMEIRLRVSDMAGNPAESHTNLLPAPDVNPMRPLGTNAAAPSPAPANPLAPLGPPPAAVPADSRYRVPAADSQALGPPTLGTGCPGRTPWPADNVNTNAGGAPRPPFSPNDTVGGSVAVRDNSAANRFVSNPGPVAPAVPTNPFNGFTASPPPAGAIASNNVAEVGPPPGVKLRWINTTAFQLTYDPRALGVVGNVPVELWGTRDGGKSWQTFGRDSKGQSPMLVTTTEEGIYGFRMVIENNPATAGRPPLPGETPGIWIGIDKTRPVGRILSARQGLGRESDKLFITWEASDNRELAAKPISLSFSDRPGGPWNTVAAQLENSGRYDWPLNGNLPQRVYLRLEIQDAAGNLGIYELPEPATLNLSTPTAPVRELNPIGRLNAPPGDPTYLR